MAAHAWKEQEFPPIKKNGAEHQDLFSSREKSNPFVREERLLKRRRAVVSSTARRV